MKPGNPVKVWTLKHALTSGVTICESTDAEMAERWASVKPGWNLLGKGDRATSERDAAVKVRELIKRRRKAIDRELAKLRAMEDNLAIGMLPMEKERK